MGPARLRMHALSALSNVVAAYLSGNSGVIWPNDNQRGPNAGTLRLNVDTSGCNVEELRLDVDTLHNSYSIGE